MPNGRETRYLRGENGPEAGKLIELEDRKTSETEVSRSRNLETGGARDIEMMELAASEPSQRETGGPNVLDASVASQCEAS